tara:strand:- start:1756 stop:2265 length:510 start_codon:yes stop_codon:yes gene_type:complete
MNFFKVVIFLLISFLLLNKAIADTSEKDILKKAKEINQKIKQQQSDKTKNIAAEVGEEEPLPLNDPFVGDASLGGGTTTATIVSDSDEDRSGLSLYNFKLVGIVTGEYESYVSLINSSGEIVTLQMNEELSPGVKLVALNPDEATFEKDADSYLKINFKNQIKETSDIY